MLAHDASDDFETKMIPPEAEKAKQQAIEVLENAKENLIGGSPESSTSSKSDFIAEISSRAPTNVASVAGRVASKASSAIYSDAVSSAAYVASMAKEAVSNISNDMFHFLQRGKPVPNDITELEFRDKK